MPLNINNIKQASPKANQVATEKYVDTSIAAIDVTQDISSNNDAFAKMLGYANYSAMVAAASSGQTIINGGYINTDLIEANGIVANQIATYNLTSTNAIIQNGLITDAKIADAAITNAKIGDLSVSTLKIQNEAVTVPRAASGNGSVTIYYTPTITHSVTFLLTGGYSAYNTVYRLYVNGSIWYQSPSGFGERISLNMLGTLYANVSYTITFNTTVQSGYPIPDLQLIMLGVKK